MTDPGTDNPYAPPRGMERDYVPEIPQPEVAPGQPVSSAPKVFGVLSIVFASLVLLFGLMQSCSGLVASAVPKIAEKASQGADGVKNAQMKDGLQHMATVYTGMGIQGLILVVMSSLLLAIGIGQIRYRRWAGRWTLYWSWAGFLAVGIMVAISFLVIGPAYEAFFEAMSKSSPTGAMPAAFTGSMSTIIGGTTGVLTLIFYAPYPILLLIFFSRAHVRGVMTR